MHKFDSDILNIPHGDKNKTGCMFDPKHAANAVKAYLDRK